MAKNSKKRDLPQVRNEPRVRRDAAPPPKASRSSGAPPPPRPPRFRRTRFFLRHLLIWLVLVGLAYWLWLDREVTSAFEHKQWVLPARVFARPLELYPGANVSRERLTRKLDTLGYQRVSAPNAVGQYRVSGEQVEFFSRGFKFWDFPEGGRHVEVNFAGGVPESVIDRDSGQPIDLMRLEPPEIGRINPANFEDRKLLAFDEVPKQFVAALVAVEDRRFFKHHGVDFIGLLRAFAVNIMAQRVVQGGSTLTQQLVKNLYLTHERTLLRKMNEILMAVSLERQYSKEKIIETYMNEVFLGQDGNRAIHGFELAAHFYFAKPLSELDWLEAATLLGMVKGPTVFDPRRHPEQSKARRDVVLGLLANAALIPEKDLEALRKMPMKLRGSAGGSSHEYPAFMALVRRQLSREYSPRDLDAAGLNIFTTLDVEVQQSSEEAIRTTLPDIEKRTRKRDLQGSLIILDPASGEVLGMVSDRDPDYAGFNRVVDARRPIGSVVKPLVYSLALGQPARYSLLTTLNDSAVTWTGPDGKRWQPQNFDKKEHGSVSLLYALTHSFNMATVNLGLQLGLSRVTTYLQHLGVPGKLPQYPSVLLGAVELSPLELAEVYTVFANDGFRVPARVINAVTDQNQRKLKRYGLALQPVMEPATAALMRYALTRVVAEGTATALAAQLPGVTPLAGKTGTSNDSRDSWFAGFGGNLLGVAWVGRDDNKPTGLTGSTGAMRVWAAAMKGAAITPLELQLPAEVEWHNVDLRSSTVLPGECPTGVAMPIHRDSPVVHADDCSPQSTTPTPIAPTARGSVFDRLEELLH
ncbi:MAG: penicillin-binding protein 1B [Gammaproteobacteria bacterium]|nr:penicillin-binding protein 1B [Gammaproteobacteria bacterium]